MKQCKLCGTPFNNNPAVDELLEHWKKHHSWHWEKNRTKNPEDVLLKKR